MVVTFALVLTLALAPAVQQPETLSLLEEPLYAPSVSKAERARLENEAAEARADLTRDPANADAALRLARAQRDLGRIGDALETLTRAVEGKADVPKLRLERGRGFIAIRKFELAQRELRKAADTIPEAHCDIAFASYLLADYKAAHDGYGKCGEPGIFGYLAALRSGAAAGPRPPVPADPGSQSREVKLPGSVATKPAKAESSIAAAYMDAVDRQMASDKAGAKDLLKPIVEKHKSRWMEPVYIAAESDYARILKAEPKKKKKRKL
jgi:tetratricopeptide (TPR) repeat protein